MSFLNEFLNQDRTQLTSIDDISDKEEEEERNSCRFIKKKIIRNIQKTLLHFKIITIQRITNLNQIQRKRCLFRKKNRNLIIQSKKSTSTTMKYLMEKKRQENTAPHPIDNFFL